MCLNRNINIKFITLDTLPKNSIVERKIRTINELMIYTKDNFKIPYIIKLIYNRINLTVDETTGYLPYELYFKINLYTNYKILNLKKIHETVTERNKIKIIIK
ncbi:hypothetical protein DMUE_1273 [Dictyocoela muelleri]|nr:hypothetical protein DMUE_1273 [Dictyocoela muelleri]